REPDEPRADRASPRIPDLRVPDQVGRHHRGAGACGGDRRRRRRERCGTMTGTDAPAEETLDVTNPATGEVLAQVPLSSASDLDAAVNAARSAMPTWREVSV